MPLRIPTILLFIILLLPATATAQKCESLPGRAALDQYCQAIPDGEGGGSDAEGRPDRTVRDSAPPSTARQLADAGEDGDVLLGLPSTGGTGQSGAQATDASGDEAGGPSTKPRSSSTPTSPDASGGGNDGSGGSTSEGDREIPQVSPDAPPPSDLVASNAATRLDPAWLVALGLSCLVLLTGMSYFRRQGRQSE